MADASLTNIRMVRPKGPKIFLGVLAVALVAGVAWWFTRPPSPTGETDEPHRIMVVDGDPDIAASLRELGFDASHGTFDGLQGEASGSGIEGILRLADERGIGYVAVHEPASRGIAMTVTGDSDNVSAEHDWAVFTVGDLGMPPRVTAIPERSALTLPPYIAVLKAAFRQQRLASTLFAEQALPMDAVELHAKIKPAVELHGAYAVLEQRVKREVRTRTEVLIDGDTGSTAPLLADSLERSAALPLADGTTLAMVRRSRLDSPRDPEVSLQPVADVELWYYPPGSTELTERKRCSSLRGGTLPLDSSSYIPSTAVDALLLESGSGLELWSLETQAAACSFTRKGGVPHADGVEHGWGTPHRSGRVLRPASEAEGMAVRVWTAGQDVPETILLPGCTRVGDPLWLDGEHFAISCAYSPPAENPWDDIADDELEDGEDPAAQEPRPEPVPEQSWIYVVRIADQHMLAFPTEALGAYKGVYALHAVPGPQLDLLARHPYEHKLARVRAAHGVSRLFASMQDTFIALQAEQPDDAAPAAGDGTAPPADEGAGDPPAAAPSSVQPAFVPAGAMVVAMAADGLEVSEVTLQASPEDLAVSPDGKHLLHGTGDGSRGHGHALYLVPLDGSQPRMLANNPQADHGRALFTADSTSVVFNSFYDGTKGEQNVGRLVSIDAAPKQ